MSVTLDALQWLQNGWTWQTFLIFIFIKIWDIDYCKSQNVKNIYTVRVNNCTHNLLFIYNLLFLISELFLEPCLVRIYRNRFI